jgi:hypothetical protein
MCSSHVQHGVDKLLLLLLSLAEVYDTEGRFVPEKFEELFRWGGGATLLVLYRLLHSDVGYTAAGCKSTRHTRMQRIQIGHCDLASSFALLQVCAHACPLQLGLLHALCRGGSSFDNSKCLSKVLCRFACVCCAVCTACLSVSCQVCTLTLYTALSAVCLIARLQQVRQDQQGRLGLGGHPVHDPGQHEHRGPSRLVGTECKIIVLQGLGVQLELYVSLFGRTSSP